MTGVVARTFDEQLQFERDNPTPPHACTACLAFVLDGIPMDVEVDAAGVGQVHTYCPECDAKDSLVELATVRA